MNIFSSVRQNLNQHIQSMQQNKKYFVKNPDRVMHQEQLFPMIRSTVKKLDANYITTKELSELDSYIVPASLHDNQGIIGALELGKRAYYRWEARC